jgi:hypothetical protein
MEKNRMAQYKDTTLERDDVFHELMERMAGTTPPGFSVEVMKNSDQSFTLREWRGNHYSLIDHEPI